MSQRSSFVHLFKTIYTMAQRHDDLHRKVDAIMSTSADVLSSVQNLQGTFSNFLGDNRTLVRDLQTALAEAQNAKPDPNAPPDPALQKAMEIANQLQQSADTADAGMQDAIKAFDAAHASAPAGSPIPTTVSAAATPAGTAPSVAVNASGPVAGAQPVVSSAPTGPTDAASPSAVTPSTQPGAQIDSTGGTASGGVLPT